MVGFIICGIIMGGIIVGTIARGRTIPMPAIAIGFIPGNIVPMPMGIGLGMPAQHSSSIR